MAFERVKFVLASAAILTAMALLLRVHPPLLERFELVLYDQLQTFIPAPALQADDAVVIVAIDDKSLQALGQWPWPRSVHADLLEQLKGNGARVVGYDMAFAEPDRLGAAHDTALATALAQGNTVLAWLSMPPNTHAPVHKPVHEIVVSPHLKISSVDDDPALGSGSFAFLNNPGAAVRSIAMLDQASSGGGLAAFPISGDGVTRSLPLIFNADQTVIPAFALEVGRASKGAFPVTVSTSRFGIENIRFHDGRSVTTNEAGEILLRFRTRDLYQVVSAVDVLQGKTPPTMFSNKVVLIGATAAGLDNWPTTPLGEVLPGVFIHATAIEQLLSGGSIFRPFYMTAIEIIVLGVLGVVLIAAHAVLRPWAALGVLVCIEVGLLGVTAYLFAGYGLVLYPVYPMGSLVVLYAALLFIKSIQPSRQLL